MQAGHPLIRGVPSSDLTAMHPCAQVAAAQPPKFDEPVIEKKAEELVAQQVILWDQFLCIMVLLDHLLCAY